MITPTAPKRMCPCMTYFLVLVHPLRVVAGEVLDHEAPTRARTAGQTRSCCRETPDDPRAGTARSWGGSRCVQTSNFRFARDAPTCRACGATVRAGGAPRR